MTKVQRSLTALFVSDPRYFHPCKLVSWANLKANCLSALVPDFADSQKGLTFDVFILPLFFFRFEVMKYCFGKSVPDDDRTEKAAKAEDWLRPVVNY